LSVQKTTLIVLILAGGVALLVAGCQAVRAGYESAPYQVVRRDGKFELRDYASLTVVETPMSQGGNGSDGSFLRLFRFISGGNAAGQKIAMTTPVFISDRGTNTTMAFVLPAKFGVGEAPAPKNPLVTLRQLAAGRFAVLRFSGGRNARHEAAALGRLKTWMTAQGLSVLSPPVYAYFDPPWTPTFLRRNEVMLQTAAGRP
jgi:hypothetical protein